MYLVYEYWPHPVEGEQGDPIAKKIRLTPTEDISQAMKRLLETYGSRLRLVTMEVCIYHD